MTAPSPPTPDASARAIAYLTACGLPPAKAEDCAASFAAHPPPDAPLDPTPDIVDALDDWALTLPTDAPPDLSAQGLARSRARMLLVGLPACPAGLCHSALPAGLAEALGRANLQAVPDIRPTPMTPQPLDLGRLSEVADETWRTFDKWPVLRGIVVWILFLVLLAAALVMVRF